MARRALILANGRFADASIPALASPVSDGLRLKALLEREDVGGYDVRLCEDTDTKAAQVAIHDFFDQGMPDDLNLLVMSGHGLKDRWSRLYFATTDTERERLSATALSAAFVRQQMDDSRAGQKVLIIDACYSGAFIENMIPKKAGDMAVSRVDFGNPEEKGTAIVTASTAVQLAGEKDFDGSVQSVFTRCLIEGIESGRADSTGNGKITLTELFDYVRARMRSEAPGQTPDVFNLRNGGAVVLARNPSWKPLALPKALVTRANSKDKIRRGSAVEDLEAIAASGAPEAPLAVDLLRKLARDDSQIVRGFAEAALGRVDLTPPPVLEIEPEPVAAPEPEQPPAISAEAASPPYEAPRPAQTLAELPQADEAEPEFADEPTGKPRTNWRLAGIIAAVVIVTNIVVYGIFEAPMNPGAAEPVSATAWLEGDWVVNQRELGCQAPFTIRRKDDATLAVAIGGASKDYAFSAATDGSITTKAYTYTRDGDRVTALGSIGIFELSKCKN